MANAPIDPANESIKQSQQDEANTYDGQQGYGVEYENGQYRSENMQQTPAGGRSGSFETNNLGGYGTGQPDADGQKHSGESSANPANPDPESGVGQGGQ